MKKLCAFLMISVLMASCSPTPQASPPAGQPVQEAATSQPTSFSRPMAVTVRPPAIPIGPIQGNPAYPVSTPTPFSIQGWQTFSDLDVGIAVDHPADWSVSQHGGETTFTSPQGSQILLDSIEAGNENSTASQPCATLVNSYGLSLTTCFDTASNLYSAETQIKTAGGSLKSVTLSTTDSRVLDVYKDMLNSLRTVK